MIFYAAIIFVFDCFYELFIECPHHAVLELRHEIVKRPFLIGVGLRICIRDQYVSVVGNAAQRHKVTAVREISFTHRADYHFSLLKVIQYGLLAVIELIAVDPICCRRLREERKRSACTADKTAPFFGFSCKRNGRNELARY